MKSPKKYYIVENTDEIKDINLINILEKTIMIQQIDKAEKNIKIEKMLEEEIYIIQNIILLKRNAKKIFDSVSLDMQEYISINFQDKELKYYDKLWKLYLPFLSQDEFSSENLNTRNGFFLSELVGNYKAFRIMREGRILNVIDQDIKNKLLKLKKQNLKFTEIL
ncbi:MAG: hypothetical protein ACRCZR_02225 [Cetobacterium sp.]